MNLNNLKLKTITFFTLSVLICGYGFTTAKTSYAGGSQSPQPAPVDPDPVPAPPEAPLCGEILPEVDLSEGVEKFLTDSLANESTESELRYCVLQALYDSANEVPTLEDFDTTSSVSDKTVRWSCVEFNHSAPNNVINNNPYFLAIGAPRVNGGPLFPEDSGQKVFYLQNFNSEITYYTYAERNFWNLLQNHSGDEKFTIEYKHHYYTGELAKLTHIKKSEDYLIYSVEVEDRKRIENGDPVKMGYCYPNEN